MRKLASIRKISDIRPIKNADFLEMAVIDGWKTVVKKGEFHIGEKIIYCEIDSFLPIRQEFDFLAKTSYRKLEDGTEGYRIKTMEFRKQISQGLVLNLNIINSLNFSNQDFEVGTDVTDLLGIRKYEKSIPKELEGMINGYIPNQIHKTDEERIQNISSYEELKKYSYSVSEKIDGESFTTFLFENRFGVCTRELDLIVPTELNDKLPKHLIYALKNDLETKIRNLGRSIAVQGELVGPGINNKYGLKDLELYIFNVFDIDNYSYMPKKEAYQIAEKLGLKTVPILDKEFRLPETMDELLESAYGISKIGQTDREGIVLVANDSDERISFKVISNKFLLKEE